MQDCDGKRFGGLVATIPLLMLAIIIMLGAPSASALVPFRGFPATHHPAFAPAFLGSPTDSSLLPSHGLSVNYHTYLHLTVATVIHTLRMQYHL